MMKSRLASGSDREKNKNSEDIQLVDPKSKPLIAKLPGSESQYALVTISRQDQKPYYHLIDLSLPGHGTAANPRGEVTSVNNPITSDNYKYGRHLTAKEDLVNNKTHIYHYRYLPSPVGANPGQTELLAYTFSGTGTPQVKTMTYLPGRDSLGLGELQISGDGTQLAYYNRNQLISAFVHQEVKLHVMTLNSQNTGIQGQVISYDGKPSGNYEKGAIEFTPEGDEFYHSQRGVFLENQNPITNTGGSDKNIWLYDPGTQQLISTTTPQDYLFRELVRAKNDTLYTPLMFASNDSIDYLRNGMYGRQGLNTTSGTFQLASNLPTQPYRLSGGDYESEFAREVGNKQYELKDHLGNVRVVVEDIKTAFDANNDGNDDSYTASILSFNDYYPFGQITSDRSFNANSYDYGFNGMREDNEWKGEGNSLDFGARIYSPRIGKFLSIDPEERSYPSLGPYNFVNNNPLLLIDPAGKEWVNAHTVRIKKYQQQLKNPDANDSRLKKLIANERKKEEQVDKMIRAIKTNDRALYNYIDNLKVVNTDGDEVNVPVRVSSNSLISGPNGQSGVTRASKVGSDGNVVPVRYKGKGIGAPIINKGKENEGIGFNVTIYGNFSFSDETLADEAGNVMYYMEYNDEAFNSVKSSSFFQSGGGGYGAYINKPSEKYSQGVADEYKNRKESGEGKDPNNNPYPMKKESDKEK